MVSEWNGPRRRPLKRIYQISDRGRVVLRWWSESLEERIALMGRFQEEFRRVFRPIDGGPSGDNKGIND